MEGFQDLQLHPHVISGLWRRSIREPTPIQIHAITVILNGNDLVVLSKKGSGKTFSYLISLVHKFRRFSHSPSTESVAPRAIIILPSLQRCQEVSAMLMSLLRPCGLELKFATSEMEDFSAGVPDVFLSTPGCMLSRIENVLQDSLELLILHEVDHGYEQDLKRLIAHVPKSCQCLLLSSDESADVEKLKSLVIRNPYIVTLLEDGCANTEITPYNVEQFYIPCNEDEKPVCISSLVDTPMLPRKILIFTNSTERSYMVEHFFRQFDGHR